MATEQNLYLISRTAGADLSASQYRFVAQDATGAIAITQSTGGSVLGVLQNNPVAGQIAAVAVNGSTKVVAGAALDAGVNVTTDANGAAVEATSGQFIHGQTLSASSDAGDLISLHLRSGTA